MRTCAICTSLVATGSLQPLGRNDALVFVCARCNDERPVEKQGRRLDHSDSGRGGRDQIHAAANRVIESMGRVGKRVARPTTMARTATPGWILVRVRQRRSWGVMLDHQTALETLRHKPWFAELRALGSDGGWFLFERPGQAASTNPTASEALEPIEQFQVKP